MDYIIKKLNSYVKVSEINSVERQTLLRERVEYILFLALGVLWNKNLDDININKRKEIVENLYRMSIGQVVGAIRGLDVRNELMSKKQIQVLEKYPELRNHALGHGYTHEDNEENIEKALEALYQELIQFDFFAQSYDIVQVDSICDGRYEGIRYSERQVGMPDKWCCPKEVLGEGVRLNDVFLLGSDMKYYRISPFIFIFDKGESVYVFQSLEDKLSGNLRLNRLFRSETKCVKADELIYVAYDSERRRISANGTIMNYYDRNYSNYISLPVEKEIKEFLNVNRSNVQATVWGHGGVGKTACVQNVCMELFNKRDSDFSYIIFVSAKDRKYDTFTGRIKGVKGIRTYGEILDSIMAVVYDEDVEEKVSDKEKKIFDISSRTLIVIDDYETFGDSEKEKIQRFIHRLNIDFFKVLLTTRNKRFSSGIEIKLDEFNKEETKKFILEIFSKEYRNYYSDIDDILSDETMLDKIFEATSGRALFLYQFANLFVQKGLDSNALDELKQSDNAKEFLYGRIYNYLGNTAQKEFKVISQIVDENDMIFKEDVIFFLLNEEENDDLEDGLQELLEQKIIERYDAENYRVYSKDMIVRMEELFSQSDDKFKDYIKNRLHIIGGKKIKGTVYEAMLEEANASRYIGNVRETLQKYKQILNDKKCDKRIKKKALLNLTSYISINLSDNEQTIQVFDDYIGKLEFQNDVDIIKMYVQYLWRSDDVAKEKACDLLDRFFRNKMHKKTRESNFELFAMATNYLCHNVLENTPEKVKSSAENRIVNEYGMELFDFISKGQFNDFKPSIRHNVSLALIATAKVALDLSKRGYDRRSLIQGIKEFGEKNFNELFRNQLVRLEYKQEKVLDGEIIDARVTYIARYGVLVDIDKIGKAIIHNTEMKYGQRNGMRKGDIIKAKIIGQNEKGFILSTKNLEE